ncbi:MAG TPA: hypothetical protein DCL73_06610 [Treponema sp.]|nr:hypothetical protein [Treponema sp.]
MDKKNENKEKQPLLYRIVRRTVLFLTLFLTSLLLFYVIGNYQEFVDENQNLILDAVTVTSFLLVFFSACGLAGSVLLFFRQHERYRYVFAFVRTAAAFVYGFACMFASRIIDFLSGGI